MSLRRRFAPPVFPGDEKKTLRAEILHYTLLGNIGLMVCCVVAYLLNRQLPYQLLVLELGFGAFTFLLHRLMLRGWVQTASFGLLAYAFIAITLGVSQLGTIRVPTTGFYVALVLAAGFLFDLAGMITLVVLSSLAVGGLIIAENAGLLPRPDYTVTLTQWIITAALLASVGGWTYAALATTKRALQRAEKEVFERRRAEIALHERNIQLAEALGKVKTLSGMLPICSGCKKIRDDQNYWHQVESYLAAHTDASFTHSLCPACVEEYFPDSGKPKVVTRIYR